MTTRNPVTTTDELRAFALADRVEDRPIRRSILTRAIAQLIADVRAETLANQTTKEVTHGAPGQSPDRGETAAGATDRSLASGSSAEVPVSGRGVDVAANAAVHGDEHVQRDGRERPPTTLRGLLGELAAPLLCSLKEDPLRKAVAGVLASANPLTGVVGEWHAVEARAIAALRQAVDDELAAENAPGIERDEAPATPDDPNACPKCGKPMVTRDTGSVNGSTIRFCETCSICTVSGCGMLRGNDGSLCWRHERERRTADDPNACPKCGKPMVTRDTGSVNGSTIRFCATCSLCTVRGCGMLRGNDGPLCWRHARAERGTASAIPGPDAAQPDRQRARWVLQREGLTEDDMMQMFAAVRESENRRRASARPVCSDPDHGNEAKWQWLYEAATEAVKAWRKDAFHPVSHDVTMAMTQLSGELSKLDARGTSKATPLRVRINCPPAKYHGRVGTVMTVGILLDTTADEGGIVTSAAADAIEWLRTEGPRPAKIAISDAWAEATSKPSPLDDIDLPPVGTKHLATPNASQVEPCLGCVLRDDDIGRLTAELAALRSAPAERSCKDGWHLPDRHGMGWCERCEDDLAPERKTSDASPDDGMLLKLRWLRDTVGVDIERMFARAQKEKDGRETSNASPGVEGWIAEMVDTWANSTEDEVLLRSDLATLLQIARGTGSASPYREDMRRIGEALGLHENVCDVGHILGAVDELRTSAATTSYTCRNCDGEPAKRIDALEQALAEALDTPCAAQPLAVDDYVRGWRREPNGDLRIGRVVNPGTAGTVLVDWFTGPDRHMATWFPGGSLVRVDAEHVSQATPCASDTNNTEPKENDDEERRTRRVRQVAGERAGRDSVGRAAGAGASPLGGGCAGRDGGALPAEPHAAGVRPKASPAAREAFSFGDHVRCTNEVLVEHRGRGGIVKARKNGESLVQLDGTERDVWFFDQHLRLLRKAKPACTCALRPDLLGHGERCPAYPRTEPVEATRSSGEADGPLARLPLPAPGSAVEVINSLLSIDAAITHKGDEVKCWTRDIEEGGVSKAYLGASECHVLSRAFAALAAQFTSATPKGGT